MLGERKSVVKICKSLLINNLWWMPPGNGEVRALVSLQMMFYNFLCYCCYRSLTFSISPVVIHTYMRRNEWHCYWAAYKKVLIYYVHKKKCNTQKKAKIKKTFWLYTDGHFSFQCSCTERFFLMCFWLLNDKRTPKKNLSQKKNEKFVIKTNSNFFFSCVHLMINKWRICRHNNENN